MLGNENIRFDHLIFEYGEFVYEIGECKSKSIYRCKQNNSKYSVSFLKTELSANENSKLTKLKKGTRYARRYLK